MSKTRSIDFRILDKKTGVPAIPALILDTLLAAGWTIYQNNGLALYLPPGDGDMFNWELGQLTHEELKKIIEKEVLWKTLNFCRIF